MNHTHRCPFCINRRCHLPSFTFCLFIYGIHPLFINQPGIMSDSHDHTPLEIGVNIEIGPFPLTGMVINNNVLLVKIALGRELVNPIYHHLRNLLFRVNLFRNPSFFINQPMGIWDIYGEKNRWHVPENDPPLGAQSGSDASGSTFDWFLEKTKIDLWM